MIIRSDPVRPAFEAMVLSAKEGVKKSPFPKGRLDIIKQCQTEEEISPNS
jgi:hypothetical protein